MEETTFGIFIHINNNKTINFSIHGYLYLIQNPNHNTPSKVNFQSNIDPEKVRYKVIGVEIKGMESSMKLVALGATQRRG